MRGAARATPRLDPSPTALRSPLSPRERATILIFIPLHGERGDRKAVGEGSFFNRIDFDGTLAVRPKVWAVLCGQSCK